MPFLCGSGAAAADTNVKTLQVPGNPLSCCLANALRATARGWIVLSAADPGIS